MLEGIRAENGDLQVVTDEYAGGGYDLYVCTPRVVQDEKRSTAPVVIIDGEEPFSANTKTTDAEEQT